MPRPARVFAVSLAALGLAACGADPAPEPGSTQSATPPEPAAAPVVPAPVLDEANRRALRRLARRERRRSRREAASAVEAVPDAAPEPTVAVEEALDEPFTLEMHTSCRGELIRTSEQLMSLFGDVNKPRLTIRLKTRRDVHGVAPHIVEEATLSDDPRRDRSAVDPDAHLQRQREAISY